MTDQPTTEPAERRCQWCDAIAPAKATHCPSCAAALPLEGDLDELAVPGVTTLDPELALYKKQPLRIPGGSPSQGLAAGAIGAAAAGGPGGLLALGALAAVAANEYRSAGSGGRSIDPDRIGQPSTPALEIAKRLQQKQAEESDPKP